MAVSLSRPLLELLDAKIDSFEKLELVVALYRRDSKRATVGDLARDFDWSRHDVREIVAALRHAHLLAGEDEEVVLAPADANDNPVIDELVVVYDTDKIALVKAIADVALARLRNLAGRAFADAFVIGKKSGGGNDR